MFDEESEDGEEKQDENLISYLTSSEQLKNWIAKISNEEMNPYVFNTNTNCMYADCYNEDNGQLSNVVIYEGELEEMIVENVKKEHNTFSVLKKEEVTISLRGKHKEISVAKESEIDMFYKSNQAEICIVEEEKIAHGKLVQSVSIKDKDENAEAKDDRHSDIMLLKYEEEIKLQKMKEQLINAQWRDEMLKANEYQEKDLETETSNETKESQCFEIKILCMFAGEKNKGER